MPGDTQVSASVPDALLALLPERLPSSLTILRRLQLATCEVDLKPDARIVFVADSGSLGDGSAKPRFFTAAYANFANANETQMFIYSTLEDKSRGDLTPDDLAEHKAQLDRVMEALSRLRMELNPELVSLVLGSLHPDVRAMLEQSGRVEKAFGNYDKWLFRREDLPRSERPLPDGMHWDGATFDDLKLVVSRTSIPRTPDTLSRLPGLMIKLEDKTPVAWAFLGVDGSLISVHCGDGYRRKGLAKSVAGRLLREYVADDGWSSADVSEDNVASRAMCKSLNGKPSWVISWVLLDITESGQA